MNNKGFAITGFIYTIFVLFIIVMIAILNMFNARKNILDKLRNGVSDEVNRKPTSTTQTFTINGDIAPFKAYKSSFYRVTLKAGAFTSKGGIVSFDIYLNKDEVLYMKNGAIAKKDESSTTYNVDVIISFDRNFASSNIIASASHVPDTKVKNMVATYINNRKISNPHIETLSNTSDKNTVEINAINKSKINDDLNRIQYIKDCINGGSGSNPNSWSEIKVSVNGQNIAKGIIPTVSSSVANNNTLKNMTDDNVNTYVKATSSGEVCATIDLGRPYNIDTIQVVHEADQVAYANKLYVSSDNKEYKVIRNSEELENSTGLIVDAYEDKHVMRVGNVYAPLKKFAGATWLRVLHHNTVNGTVYWSAKAQPLTDGGYEAIHKQSILYNLEHFKNKSGQFEFLLEYSDLDGYNRWIQTSNPVTTVEDVTGYKKVETSWEKTNWYGLASSSSGSALLDGNKGSSWWYAVGVINPHQGGIPAFDSNISKGITNLWVRIDNL